MHLTHNYDLAHFQCRAVLRSLPYLLTVVARGCDIYLSDFHPDKEKVRNEVLTSRLIELVYWFILPLFDVSLPVYSTVFSTFY